MLHCPGDGREEGGFGGKYRVYQLTPPNKNKNVYILLIKFQTQKCGMAVVVVVSDGEANAIKFHTLVNVSFHSPVLPQIYIHMYELYNQNCSRADIHRYRYWASNATVNFPGKY